MSIEFSPVGRFGQYNVSQLFEAKRFFVKKTVIVDGKPKTESFPVRKTKKTVRLQHDAGDIVDFAVYIHQGVLRYKDSRAPKKSMLSNMDVVSEVKRMLGIEQKEAEQLLSLTGETKEQPPVAAAA